MLRIDSKQLPLKRSCTDVLNPSLVYGYECVMLLVWCSFCHWLLSLCFEMVDIVTEQWIQIHWLEQALHITQFLFGAKIHEVPKLRVEGSPKMPLQCARVIRMVRDGYFGFKDYFESL